MRLLQLDGDDVRLKEFVKDPPPYAILSHAWFPAEDEPIFQEVSQKLGTHKRGYEKILNCGRIAALAGIDYFWVDTCCIDKQNNTELSEAINSMFNWYRDAAICYVYLDDVVDELDNSRWFKRGWTLQELIAPKEINFFNQNWQKIDSRRNLSPKINKITGIPLRILAQDFNRECSFAQIMS